METRIGFNCPHIAGRELYNVAEAVIRHRKLAGNGFFTQACQRWLCERLGVGKALLTHSCTAALEMASLLLDIKPGDEVIVPSFTFVSTANAFVLRGAVPVFVDIRPDTFNLDETRIAGALTEKTKAIIPVHYAGVPCQMQEILDMANAHGVCVVEDAAHALLAKSEHGTGCLGSVGHLGCLSFHETKNVISGEGGALLINDPRLFERADILWEKGTNRAQFFEGRVDKYTWVDVGSSFLPSELTAAFLHAQLEQADRINARRLAICQRYMEGLRDVAEHYGLQIPSPMNANFGNGHLFYILTRTPGERKALLDYLAEQGIVGTFHYVPLHSSPAGRRFGRCAGGMDVTDSVSSRIVRLPVYFDLTDENVDDIISFVLGFYGSRT